MYAKCGRIEDARKVFHDLPHRNVVSWNAMLAGYAQHGSSFPAIEFFAKMRLEGIQPDKVMYLCIIKACSNMGFLEQGRLAHGQIMRSDMKVDLVLESTLIDMYSRCGSLEDARKVYDVLPHGNVVALGAMIAGYVEQGQDFCALELFVEMHKLKGNPDKVTFLYVLRACANVQSSVYAYFLHQQIIRTGLDSDLMVVNTLVNTYCKSAGLQDAHKVFETFKNRDVVSFGIMMAGYLQHELGHASIELFWRMKSEGVEPDEATYVCSLKASCSIGALEEGSHIYCQIIRDGLELNPAIGTALIDMYAKRKCLRESHSVFKSLSGRNVILWTAIIASYSEQGYALEALDMFDKMQTEIVVPDKVTFLFVVKACIITEDLEKGKLVHSQMTLHGFEADVAIGSALIDMYFKCRGLQEAQNIFDSLPHQNVVTWAALISGYVQSGSKTVAFGLFDAMLQKGVQPDRVIFLCILKACGTIGARDKGQEIHTCLVTEEFEGDSFVGNALVAMYAKCGLLEEAQDVFDYLSVQDVVSWTALIAGSADHGDNEVAVILYYQMHEQGLLPNDMTFASILKACTSTSDEETGKRLHVQIQAVSHLESLDLITATALIDMYARCGSMADAQEVFDAMPKKDLVGWNALMTGYTRQGESKLVFQLFDRMKEEGVQPDQITYLSVLTACSHAGLVDKGRFYFDALGEECGIAATIKHYNCMVDLLGRAGELKEALTMLQNMPSPPDLVAWGTLLAACRRWGNVEIGRQAFEATLRLDEKHDAAFNSMFYIYADANMWEEAKKIEAMREAIRAGMEHTKSWIDTDGSMHTFVVGDGKLEAVHDRVEEERLVQGFKSM
eukprot:c24780_g1_i4 orf=665-3196(+)